MVAWLLATPIAIPGTVIYCTVVLPYPGTLQYEITNGYCTVLYRFRGIRYITVPYDRAGADLDLLLRGVDWRGARTW